MQIPHLCKLNIILFAVTLIANFPVLLCAQSQDRIFWFRENFISGSNGLGVMDLDGSNNSTILSGSSLSGGAIGSAIDFTGLKIYWTDRSGNIKRSNLDGTNVQNLVSGLSLPWQIALDVANSKMYFGELSGTRVMRANLDGTNVETLYNGTGGSPGVALDLTNNKVYFARSDGDAIMRMNLDGSSQETVISSDINHPIYLALDIPGDKIYISDYYNNSIKRANLNGTGITSIASVTSINGLALDLINDKLYANSDSGTVSMMNLDGSSQTTVGSSLGLRLRSLSLDIDRDGDGVQNSLDGCPTDPNKSAAGVCGCGTADTDSDGDSTPNCNDSCPSDSGKIAVGICGCGVADTDSDADGTANCNDSCPSDSGKIAVGVCGCGVADTDSDADGTANCNDSCSEDPGKTTAGSCGCGVSDADTDSDGVLNCNETCPTDPLKTVAGFCGCGISDTDATSNSIPDCLPEEALYVKSKELHALVGKSGKKFSEKKINAALKSINNLANQYPTEGVTFTKSELLTRHNLVSKKVKELTKAVNSGINVGRKRTSAKTAVGQLMNDLIPD